MECDPESIDQRICDPLQYFEEHGEEKFYNYVENKLKLFKQSKILDLNCNHVDPLQIKWLVEQLDKLKDVLKKCTSSKQKITSLKGQLTKLRTTITCRKNLDKTTKPKNLNVLHKVEIIQGKIKKSIKPLDFNLIYNVQDWFKIPKESASETDEDQHERLLKILKSKGDDLSNALRAKFIGERIGSFLESYFKTFNRDLASFVLGNVFQAYYNELSDLTLAEIKEILEFVKGNLRTKRSRGKPSHNTGSVALATDELCIDNDSHFDSSFSSNYSVHPSDSSDSFLADSAIETAKTNVSLNDSETGSSEGIRPSDSRDNLASASDTCEASPNTSKPFNQNGFSYPPPWIYLPPFNGGSSNSNENANSSSQPWPYYPHPSYYSATVPSNETCNTNSQSWLPGSVPWSYNYPYSQHQSAGVTPATNRPLHNYNSQLSSNNSSMNTAPVSSLNEHSEQPSESNKEKSNSESKEMSSCSNTIDLGLKENIPADVTPRHNYDLQHNSNYSSNHALSVLSPSKHSEQPDESNKEISNIESIEISSCSNPIDSKSAKRKKKDDQTQNKIFRRSTRIMRPTNRMLESLQEEEEERDLYDNMTNDLFN